VSPIGISISPPISGPREYLRAEAAAASVPDDGRVTR